MYRGKKRHELPPHIYAISEAAYRSMLQGIPSRLTFPQSPLSLRSCDLWPCIPTPRTRYLLSAQPAWNVLPKSRDLCPLSHRPDSQAWRQFTLPLLSKVVLKVKTNTLEGRLFVIFSFSLWIFLWRNVPVLHTGFLSRYCGSTTTCPQWRFPTGTIFVRLAQSRPGVCLCVWEIFFPAFKAVKGWLCNMSPPSWEGGGSELSSWGDAAGQLQQPSVEPWASLKVCHSSSQVNQYDQYEFFHTPSCVFKETTSYPATSQHPPVRPLQQQLLLLVQTILAGHLHQWQSHYREAWIPQSLRRGALST